MQLLLIKLHSVNNATQETLEIAEVTNKKKISHFETVDWGQARSAAAGKKIVVFIPNEDVFLTHANVPSKNKKQLLQAVPYALEERLADDIESLHFAVHRENEGDVSHVAIINHQRMEFWLDQLKENNIHPHYVLPSILSISANDNGWTLASNENKSYLRVNKWSGFSCESNLLPLFLAEQLEESTPESILYSGNDEHYPAELSDIERQSLDDITAVNHDDIVEVLPLNLLEGFSRGESALLNVNWKPWQPVAILAGLIGAVWIGMFAWQNHMLDEKLATIEAEIDAVYLKAFPSGRVQNAPVQMSQKLSDLQKANGSVGGSSLQTIATVSPFLKKFPKIALREIRRQNDELLFVVSAPDLTSLNTFKDTLIKEGALKVEIKSSTTTANKVESTLVIKGIV